jgi:hypothetical protein
MVPSRYRDAVLTVYDLDAMVGSAAYTQRRPITVRGATRPPVQRQQLAAPAVSRVHIQALLPCCLLYVRL